MGDPAPSPPSDTAPVPSDPRVVPEPGILCFVDPQLHGCAWALGFCDRVWAEKTSQGIGVCWDAGTLLRCGFAPGEPTHTGRGGVLVQATTAAAAWLAIIKAAMDVRKDNPQHHPKPLLCALVVETPQIYRDDPTPPMDLMQLAGVVASLVTHAMRTTDNIAPVTRYPREWKKQRSKEAHHAAVRRDLSVVENVIATTAEHGLTKKQKLDLWDAVAMCKTPGWWVELLQKV